MILALLVSMSAAEGPSSFSLVPRARLEQVWSVSRRESGSFDPGWVADGQFAARLGMLAGEPSSEFDLEFLVRSSPLWNQGRGRTPLVERDEIELLLDRASWSGRMEVLSLQIGKDRALWGNGVFTHPSDPLELLGLAREESLKPLPQELRLWQAGARWDIGSHSPSATLWIDERFVEHGQEPDWKAGRLEWAHFGEAIESRWGAALLEIEGTLQSHLSGEASMVSDGGFGAWLSVAVRGGEHEGESIHLSTGGTWTDVSTGLSSSVEVFRTEHPGAGFHAGWSPVQGVFHGFAAILYAVKELESDPSFFATLQHRLGAGFRHEIRAGLTLPSDRQVEYHVDLEF